MQKNEERLLDDLLAASVNRSHSAFTQRQRDDHSQQADALRNFKKLIKAAATIARGKLEKERPLAQHATIDLYGDTLVIAINQTERPGPHSYANDPIG